MSCAHVYCSAPPVRDGACREHLPRCTACNGDPEHHTGLNNTPHGWGDCLYHWVYRGRDGVPFRLVRLSTGGQR